MRDLRADVMGDMGFTDTVESDVTERTEEGSVDRAECSSGKSPCVRSVVREKRVGVLQESNRDEPVVDPEVGNEVHDGYFSETSVVGPDTEKTESDGESEVRSEDLVPVIRAENDGTRLEVVGVFRVMFLSRSVPAEVHLPADELLHEQPEENGDRCVSYGFFEFLLSLFRQAQTVDFTIFFKRGETLLASGLGYKDFISSHVAGGGVMTTVRDSPRVIRYEKSGMDDPSDGVVDRFRRREGLMTTFVGDNPKTGAE